MTTNLQCASLILERMANKQRCASGSRSMVIASAGSQGQNLACTANHNNPPKADRSLAATAPLAFQLSPKAAFLNRKTLPFVLISFLRSPSSKRFFDIGEKAFAGDRHRARTGPRRHHHEARRERRRLAVGRAGSVHGWVQVSSINTRRLGSSCFWPTRNHCRTRNKQIILSISQKITPGISRPHLYRRRPLSRGNQRVTKRRARPPGTRQEHALPT
jgi:hypothetical protein